MFITRIKWGGRFLNTGSFDSAEDCLDGIAHQEGSFIHRSRSCRNPLLRLDYRDWAAPLALQRNTCALRRNSQTHRRRIAARHLLQRSTDRSQRIRLRISTSQVRFRPWAVLEDKERLARRFNLLYFLNIWYGHVVFPDFLLAPTDYRSLSVYGSSIIAKRGY